MSSPTIFWFRRDLRLQDSPALVAASTKAGGQVLGTWIVDETFIAPAGPTRVAFLAETLKSLDASMGAKLVLRSGEPAAALRALATEIGAKEVFATGDYGPQGRLRDERVRSALERDGITLHLIDSPYVVKPGTVMTKTGTPCRVFGAFRRGWEEEPLLAPVSAPDVQWLSAAGLSIEVLQESCGKFRPSYFPILDDVIAPKILPAGEAQAQAQVESFLRFVDNYDDDRNIPGIEGTSRLSPHLRFGAIHPRQILAQTNGLTKGRDVFRSEIAWREFYADVLFHHPDSTWNILQPGLRHLRVDRDGDAVERFRTWAVGETGYPMVDAGMRQLLEEGWMHNRVRMICASFLVKHLHLDWRWGAKWFMWHLIDGDIASNQHGWQWTAGTGTDAAPFHRVFNPTLQGERFDPEGTYVQKFIPALRGVSAPDCLQPGGGTGLLAPAGYFTPMLDANTERNEALARFAEARELAQNAK